MKFVSNENGIIPRTKMGENGGRRLGVLWNGRKTTPLGGDSKISEEDPPL